MPSALHRSQAFEYVSTALAPPLYVVAEYPTIPILPLMADWQKPKYPLGRPGVCKFDCEDGQKNICPYAPGIAEQNCSPVRAGSVGLVVSKHELPDSAKRIVTRPTNEVMNRNRFIEPHYCFFREAARPLGYSFSALLSNFYPGTCLTHVSTGGVWDRRHPVVVKRGRTSSLNRGQSALNLQRNRNLRGYFTRAASLGSDGFARFFRTSREGRSDRLAI